MVVGHGFRCVLKPDAWCASHVADHAAKGKNGESVLDESLEKRDGLFSQYINGDFNIVELFAIRIDPTERSVQDGELYLRIVRG